MCYIRSSTAGFLLTLDPNKKLDYISGWLFTIGSSDRPDYQVLHTEMIQVGFLESNFAQSERTIVNNTDHTE